MNKALPNQHDANMLDKYDFSEGVIGKYAEQYFAGRNSVRLNDDVDNKFLDEEPANAALSSLKWAGRSATKRNDYFKDIRNVIPMFDRQPFVKGSTENQYFDTIIMLPTNRHNTSVPITIVSKSYSLVQHHDVLDAVERAFNDLKYDTDKA